jgi:hypothetical protein
MVLKNNEHPTVTFSSRLQADVFSVLEKEALTNNISMNSLINNILGRYTSLERHAKDIELISLTKRAVKQIFSVMDEKSIEHLAAEVGGVVHKELVFLKFNELTFDNLMHVLVINATRYGSVKYSFEKSKHNICIHHGVCVEFSKFLSLIHEITASQLSIKMITTNTDQNTVCFEISEPN